MGKRRKIPVVQPDPVRSLLGTRPDAELDLHGRVAREAEGAVRRMVETWSRRQPGAVIRIITGRGANSQGAPVLRGLVLDLLNGDLAPRIEQWNVEVGGGSYLVQVR
jgi:hypothetical protein